MLKASIAALAIAAAPAVALQPPGPFTPARYSRGSLPALSATAVGGGEVFLELSVDETGRVARVRPLRTTPPFTELVVAAVSDWQFDPAEQDAVESAAKAPARVCVPSGVLVAAIYRPPTVNGWTFGEIPKDVAAPARDVPFPILLSVPAYPPVAFGGGVVLLEARVGNDGAVAETRVVRSAPPFDEAARAALRQWLFRPARRDGALAPGLVYVVFGFPVPVTSRK